MKRTRAFVQLTCAAFSVGLLVPGIQAQFRIDSTGVTGPVHDFQDNVSSADTFSLQFDAASAGLAGNSSVNITVSAPAGFQFVVDPPPIGIDAAELSLYVEFGTATGTILGESPSLTFGGLAGTAPGLTYSDVYISTAGDGLYASATADLTSATSSFSFTSVTFGFDYNNAGIPSDSALGAFNGGSMSYIMWFTSTPSADMTQPWMRLAAVPVPEPAGAEVLAASLLAAVAGGRVCRRHRANA